MAAARGIDAGAPTRDDFFSRCRVGVGWGTAGGFGTIAIEELDVADAASVTLASRRAASVTPASRSLVRNRRHRHVYVFVGAGDVLGDAPAADRELYNTVAPAPALPIRVELWLSAATTGYLTVARSGLDTS